MNEKINCACVIHGDKYDWRYVEKLRASICRNLSRDVNFHVFTEKNRSVPSSMIKHELVEWDGISGPKKSWWYKMQLFDPDRLSGQVLYFDLDVAIVDSLDWITDLDTDYFWAIKDWRSLWKPLWRGLNSSVMFWDTTKFNKLWQMFQSQNLYDIIRRYHGDQDFINASLHEQELKFFPDNFVVSWRWQIKDGGLDPLTRSYRRPEAGSILTPGSKILVFHGNPKPHDIQDPIIKHYWHDIG